MQVEKRRWWVQVEKAEITQRTRVLVISGKSPDSAWHCRKQLESWSAGSSGVARCAPKQDRGSGFSQDMCSSPVMLQHSEPLHWLSWCYHLPSHLPVIKCDAVLHDRQGSWAGYERPLWNISVGRKGRMWTFPFSSWVKRYPSRRAVILAVFEFPFLIWFVM